MVLLGLLNLYIALGTDAWLPIRLFNGFAGSFALTWGFLAMFAR